MATFCYGRMLMADPTLTPSSTATAPVHAANLARPMKMFIAGGVLIGIAISLIAALLLIHLHADATEHTRQTLSSLDIVLAEQTERSLDEVDLTLKDTLSLLLQQRGAVSAQTIRAIYGGHAAAQLLRAEAGGIPQLISISIFDARGGMVNSSEPNAPANLDISFRKYFQRARDNRTPTVTLKTDEAATMQRVIDVMDVLKHASITRVAIATRSKPE